MSPTNSNGPDVIVPAELNKNEPAGRQALLKRKQLAKTLSMSERTIDNLQRQKKIPVIKISPRCCRYDLAAVLRALGRFTIDEISFAPISRTSGAARSENGRVAK